MSHISLLLGVLCGSFWRSCGRDDRRLCLLQRLQHEAPEGPSFLAVYRGLHSLCALRCALQHLPEPGNVGLWNCIHQPCLKKLTLKALMRHSGRCVSKNALQGPFEQFLNVYKSDLTLFRAKHVSYSERVPPAGDMKHCRRNILHFRQWCLKSFLF